MATLGLVCLGAAIALGWLAMTTDLGWSALIGRLRPIPFLALGGLTTSNVMLRFIRWQYLLRRVGVRIPTRDSLLIYLSSLAAIVTPAYVGETVRAHFARRNHGVPVSRALTVIIAERGLDALTLATLLMVSTRDGWPFGVAATAVVVLLASGLVVRRAARLAPSVLPSAHALMHAPVLAWAGLLSLAAWLPATALFTTAGGGAGIFVPIRLGAETFARATLLGGLSLMPAGAGTTGSVAIVSLTGAGYGLGDAVLTVSILRLATVGLTLAVGAVCLAVLLREGTRRAEGSAAHFDDIANVYAHELPPHIRDLLVTRKCTQVARLVRAAHASARIGLDLGCGMGAHTHALEGFGFRVMGVDPAVKALAFAQRTGARVTAGSAEHLPFASRSFDFVYAVGVLHHVPREHRSQVYEEVRRVLKPGGVLVVHETNPNNPFFRFYMGYVFPIIRRIDEGVEEWLPPDAGGVAGMAAVAVEYGTFLPDFVPQRLMPLALRMEARLHDSRWRTYSAHYVASYRLN